VVEEKGGVVHEFRNDPLDPNYQQFQYYVALAMKYGLSSEEEPGGGKVAAGEKKKAGESAAAETPPPPWRLCFDRNAWERGLPAAGNAPMCGSKQKLGDPRLVTFLDRNGQTVKLQVLPRSTFAIFQFLGHVVAGQEAARIKLQSQDAIGNPPLKDDVLFDVEEGPRGACFLEVDYAGRDYCVPEEGARNTKRILGLLAQLIALNTSLRSIAITPQVQLIQ
jgi:hypothetical protein